MLGLADRGRIFDLLEHDLPRRHEGGDRDARRLCTATAPSPTQVLADLAEAVHAAARRASGRRRSRQRGPERRGASPRRQPWRAPLHAVARARLADAARRAGRRRARRQIAKAAAEMVLIRLAHTADLPAPDELIRTLGGGDALARGLGQAGNPRQRQRTRDTALERASAGEPADEAMDGDAEIIDEAPTERAALAVPSPDPRSFAEVIALVGERRDAKLKVHLEEHVSLVKFDALAGSIDLFLFARRAAADRQRAAREADRLDAAALGRAAIEGGGRAADRRGAARARGRRACRLEDRIPRSRPFSTSFPTRRSPRCALCSGPPRTRPAPAETASPRKVAREAQ